MHFTFNSNELYYTPNDPLVNLIMQKVKERYFDKERLDYNCKFPK